MGGEVDYKAALAAMTQERDALQRQYDTLEAQDSPGYDGNCACLWKVLPHGAGATGPQIQECAGHRDMRLRADAAEQSLAEVRGACAEASYRWCELQMDNDSIAEDVKAYHAAMDRLADVLKALPAPRRTEVGS